MNNTFTERIKRLQKYLSFQYVDFDQEITTDRLLSLYSDFSKLKTLNSYGYEANVNYWRAVILDCNLQGYLNTKDYSCFIDRNEISELFYRRKKGKPLSLNCVIEDMIHNTCELLTQKEFEKRYPVTATNPSTATLSWFQWLYYTPYHWIIPETPAHLYVVLPTVQECAKIIIQRHYQKPLCSSLDNLFTFIEFREQYGTISCYQESTIQLSDLDLWLILRYMHHHYGVAVADTVKTFGASSTVIKFPERNESEKLVARISNNDKAIINLKTACSTLHKQVTDLQRKSEEFLALSKEHHANNRKPQAVYMLKKKNQVVDILDRRLKTLETMETILLKIEASQNDIQVVQAFNLGADTLRGLLDGKEFSVDHVGKTMEKIQETLDDQKQVEEAITMGHEEIANQHYNNISQEELEQELEGLQKEEIRPVNLTQPIDTGSELLRLQNVLSSLNHTYVLPDPSTEQDINKKELKSKALAS